MDVNQPDQILHYSWAYCRECECFTYLMAQSKGTGKAFRKHGQLIGLACCRCKRKRAIVGHFITPTPTDANVET